MSNIITSSKSGLSFSTPITNAKLNNATLNTATLNSATLNSATLNSATLNSATLNSATISGTTTFTGTVNGISADMISLGNVNNVSDSLKPISIATQSALDTKAPINNPIFTGVINAPEANFATMNISNSVQVNTYFYSFIKINDSNYTLKKEHPNVTFYGANSDVVFLPTNPTDGMSVNISNMSNNDLFIRSGIINMYNLFLAQNGLTEISLPKNLMYNFIYTEKDLNEGIWNLKF
jgi:hypothetical protein